MSRKKILIADDEPHILDLMKMVLEEKHDVITARDGRETLEMLEHTKPDLILLDVMMPFVNGFEICEKLKKDPRQRKIKIAMVSAKTQERDIMEGLKLGADYYLTKPFDPMKLLQKVDEMLK